MRPSLAAAARGVSPSALTASSISRRVGCPGRSAWRSTALTSPMDPDAAARCSAVLPRSSVSARDTPRLAWRCTAALLPSAAAAIILAAADVSPGTPRSRSSPTRARHIPGETPEGTPTAADDPRAEISPVRALAPARSLAPAFAPAVVLVPVLALVSGSSPVRRPMPSRGTSSTKSPAGSPVGTPSPNSQNRVNPARPRLPCAAPYVTEAHVARHPSPSLLPSLAGPRMSSIGRLRCAANAATSNSVAGTFDRDMARTYAPRTAAAPASISSGRSSPSPCGISASAQSATEIIARRQLSSGAPAFGHACMLRHRRSAPATARTMAASTSFGETSAERPARAEGSGETGRGRRDLSDRSEHSASRSASSATVATRRSAPSRSDCAVAAAWVWPSDRIPRRSTAATASPPERSRRDASSRSRSSPPRSTAWHAISANRAQWNREFPSRNTLTCSYLARRPPREAPGAPSALVRPSSTAAAAAAAADGATETGTRPGSTRVRRGSSGWVRRGPSGSSARVRAGATSRRARVSVSSVSSVSSVAVAARRRRRSSRSLARVLATESLRAHSARRASKRPGPSGVPGADRSVRAGEEHWDRSLARAAR